MIVAHRAQEEAEKAEEDVEKHVHKKTILAAKETAALLAEKATALAREVETKARSWSRRGVSGVPFFVIYPASGSGDPVTFSGAQPSAVIAEVLTEQAEA